MLWQIKAKIADSVNAAVDLDSLAADVRAIGDKINNAILNTKFNDTELLTSTSAAVGYNASGGQYESDYGMQFQTNESVNDELVIQFSYEVAQYAKIVNDTIGNVDESNLISTRDEFKSLETSLNTFENTVVFSLGKIGNYLQRLDQKENFLTSAITNSQSSVSRLFDADVALEQLNATRAAIGAQAATAMVAQLNISPQHVLQLFG